MLPRTRRSICPACKVIVDSDVRVGMEIVLDRTEVRRSEIRSTRRAQGSNSVDVGFARTVSRALWLLLDASPPTRPVLAQGPQTSLVQQSARFESKAPNSPVQDSARYTSKARPVEVQKEVPNFRVANSGPPARLRSARQPARRSTTQGLRHTPCYWSAPLTVRQPRLG